MTRLRLIRNSLAYHRRIHIAVALGVAAATAVLTGALLVGDSVRSSLRQLTLERLGKIEAVLATDRFFRLQLATELESTPEFRDQYDIAAPAIIFPQATFEHRHDDGVSRASLVFVVGADERFWQLDSGNRKPQRNPQANEIVLNEPLAKDLNAKVGDEITLRLPKSNQVPADSPLANKNDRIRSLPNLKVVDVIPAEGLGRFSLQASQALPQNAFVSFSTLQNALEQKNRVNAILVGGKKQSRADTSTLSHWLRPTIDDFNIAVKHVKQTYRDGENEATAFEYFTVTTDRMIFDEETAEAVGSALKPFGGQPVFTYLTNSIDLVGGSEQVDAPHGVPYSMVSAIDTTEHFSLLDLDGKAIGPMADDEIVLNSWTAENLQAKPGDRIRVTYFEPETTHGEAVEKTADLTLKAVTPLTRPSRRYERNRRAQFSAQPTLANDPDLTPEVKGVTDQATIDDWDAPFPFDYDRVRDVDEEYWDLYRTTPKSFVSAAAGKKLWGSRFGQVTSFRVPISNNLTPERVKEVLHKSLADKSEALGFRFIPVKEQQLAASRGTTPFDVLFLFLSFFVIAAALLLVSLLFRLGIEQRATEIGTLLAVGFTRSGVGRLLVAEGFCIAAIGAAVGVLVGIGYARLMLAGLSSWWLGAISAPFLTFHWTWRSLVIGNVLGVLTALSTIAWTVRQTRRTSTRALLGGQATDSNLGQRPVSSKTSSASAGSGRRWTSWLWLAPFGVAMVLSVVATRLGGMAQAGAFVGSGFFLLTAIVFAIRQRLRRQGVSDRLAWNRAWLLLGLAERSAGRNPSRSLITIALMATATFLIVAMSSFRLAPTEQGVGGFRFIAQCSEPIFDDLNNQANRSTLFGTRAAGLDDAKILGLRLRPGDDASCQNLYQSTQPRILGITQQFIEHFDSPESISFPWAGAEAAEPKNPWHLFDEPTGSDQPVPAVLDKNTALYSLHLYRGIGEEFQFEYDGRPIRFRVAGLLENSVLQGSLLIGEKDFRRLFPSISGYRYFLVASPAEQSERVSSALEDRFSDQGMDVVSAHQVLEQLFAVQNTYLSTFQSLGALGLLLGAFGLATVQLRNVMERRGELALLRAVGYRRRRIAQMVLLENVLLLTAGLLSGVIAALLAVLPHKMLGEAAISWLLLRDLAIMLAAVFAAGLISSVLTIRAVLRQPLLPALRGE